MIWRRIAWGLLAVASLMVSLYSCERAVDGLTDGRGNYLTDDNGQKLILR